MRPIYLLIPLVLIATFQLASHWSLLFGLTCGLALPLRTPLLNLAKKSSTKFLQASIILLGASLDFNVILSSGAQFVFITFFSILAVMLTGAFLARLLGIPKPLSQLISAGTAICGGSAIGALSAVLKADSLSIAVSLSIVFLLNALSVFIFPPLALSLNLTQEQFGMWAALAIHDTSAVVAAGQLYGEEALKIATTLKLTRALWIIPLCFVMNLKKGIKTKFTIPWFILFFVLCSLIFSFAPGLQPLTSWFKLAAKTGFAWTLFLIGIGLNRSQLKEIKLKTLLYGITLWLMTLSASLYFVLSYTV